MESPKCPYCGAEMNLLRTLIGDGSCGMSCPEKSKWLGVPYRKKK